MGKSRNYRGFNDLHEWKREVREENFLSRRQAQDALYREEVLLAKIDPDEPAKDHVVECETYDEYAEAYDEQDREAEAYEAGASAEPVFEWEDEITTFSNFLAHVSIEECFEEMGDGFHVESWMRPGAMSPSAHGYRRVHDLARDLGIESVSLVRYLRLSGEYVTSHSSFVAVPVCERLAANAEVLVALYGARKPKRGDTFRALLAEEDERAKAKRPQRPGAPRGVNPFAPRPLAPRYDHVRLG